MNFAKKKYLNIIPSSYLNKLLDIIINYLRYVLMENTLFCQVKNVSKIYHLYLIHFWFAIDKTVRFEHIKHNSTYASYYWNTNILVTVGFFFVGQAIGREHASKLHYSISNSNTLKKYILLNFYLLLL